MTNPEGLVFAMRILTRVSKNTYNPNRLVWTYSNHLPFGVNYF